VRKHLTGNEGVAARVLWATCGPRDFTHHQIGDASAIRNGPDQGEWVELTGFEPVTPSLRKMQSNSFDQGFHGSLVGLWDGCGASDVRQREAR